MIGTLPEADRPTVECVLDVVEEVTACHGAIDVRQFLGCPIINSGF